MFNIQDYIDQINKNEIVYCEKQKQLVELIEKKLILSNQPDNYYFYDDKESTKIIKFLESLTQFQDEFAGKKLKLQPWQCFLIHCIYGFRLKKDNTPLHVDVLVEIGKKNGKTLLGSGLLLYSLLTREGAEIYTCATDYEQSKKCFTNIVEFIKRSPKLMELFTSGDIEIKERDLIILYHSKVSKIKCVSESRAKSAQGFKPSFLLFDEIASYQKKEMIEKYKSGRTDSSGAIALSITTAEKNKNNAGFWEYERAENILSGKFIADSYLPCIFELDKDDAWVEPKNYPKANPNLGITGITIDGLIKERDTAIQDPTAELAFKAYKLNIWSQSSSNGIKDKDWQEVKDNYEKYRKYLTEDKLKSYQCFGAIDLSKSDDYTAYSLCFYIPEIDKYYFKHLCFIPKGMLTEKTQTDNQQLYQWVEAKLIKPSMGGGPNHRIINMDDLVSQIKIDTKKYNIFGYGLDPAMSRDFKEKMANDLPEIKLIDFSQKWDSICPANRRFINFVQEANLICENPVADWMVSCSRIEIGTNNNIYFEKVDYRQSNKRIDLIDTSVMSLSLMYDNKDSDYSVEDIMTKVLAFEY